MATRKPKPEDATPDLDDLLAEAEDDLLPEVPEAPAEPEAPADGTLPAALARIAELEAALAAPIPQYKDEDPEESEPTAEELRIKELEDALAKRQATALLNASPTYAPAATGDVILIHVVEDGFTALGEVWYRGQEMEFEVGGDAYKRTKNARGKSWVDLAGDLEGQYARWGKQMIGLGKFIPRPNERFEDEVAKADTRRGRKVPLLASAR